MGTAMATVVVRGPASLRMARDQQVGALGTTMAPTTAKMQTPASGPVPAGEARGAVVAHVLPAGALVAHAAWRRPVAGTRTAIPGRARAPGGQGTRRGGRKRPAILMTLVLAAVAGSARRLMICEAGSACGARVVVGRTRTSVTS
jgi:hypothetical protein